MPDPLSQVSTRTTPQSAQADARQVPNSAGGWTFTASKQARLNRFLTLGTERGTYYASEKALTRENAQVVIEWARNDARTLVEKAMDVSMQGRAPRNNPALFALAAAAGLGGENGRKRALHALPHVARTATHLFTFCGYAQQFRGWGRGLRNAVADWYLDKDPDKLAYQMVKYRQREGWTHRDLLRLAHPAALDASLAHRALFDWACGRKTASLPPLVQAFEMAKDMTTAREWCRLIEDHPDLTWEMLPDAALAEKDVWAELVGRGMPQTALMRQLPRLTRLGVVSQTGILTRAVTEQLADARKLRHARVHPMSVLLAMRTYAQGHGLRGHESWTPVARVTDALDAAFYASYGAVEPAMKRVNVALDVSGSMTAPVAGMPMSCREASAALALVIAATEPKVVITGFTTGPGQSRWGRYGTAITPLGISPRQRLDDAVRTVSGLPFGGTDCALPMLWAAREDVAIDTFLVVTDNETWSGSVHPHQALEQYRQKTGIPARLAVAALAPTEFTIADPDDPGSLDISGFDSAVPGLLADFSRGDI
jgi:60 kDa SS-A/Ro ribonucleoprotein